MTFEGKNDLKAEQLHGKKFYSISKILKAIASWYMHCFAHFPFYATAVMNSDEFELVLISV